MTSEKTYEIVVGLEIHVQLNTNSKAFCSDANKFADEANSHVSTISLAHPGTLPKMNTAHIEKAVLLALAFQSEIQNFHYFDRKNYFYPDLPKGYQITQDKKPYCIGGNIHFISDKTAHSIRIHHIHMEEDAGKSNHEMMEAYSLIDLNRAGVPLLEIVTEPDFRSGQEVSDFLAYLQKTVQYLGISEANMEEGGFRCDCNVSVRKKGASHYSERCEIKNMNSRKFAKLAIDYEANRQIDIIENGGNIQRTTMLFDSQSGVTRPMRKKESETDYRYFPEPDLPPLCLTEEYIDAVRSQMTLLPFERYIIMRDQCMMSHADAEYLIEEKKWSDVFFSLVKKTAHTKDLAELLILKVIPYLKSVGKTFDDLGDIDRLLAFVDIVTSGMVSKSAAYQQLFPIWIEDTQTDLLTLATQLDLIQSSNQDFLDDLIQTVLDAWPEKVQEYRKGKKGLIGFFMGQVKQKAGGQANPEVMAKKLETQLDERGK